MRVSTWIVSLAAVAVVGAAAAAAESRRVELSCVNKSGENMYRAVDGSVVWTASCGHVSRCADAVVTMGTTPNSGVIRWYGGGSCHVVNASFSRSAQASGSNSGKRKKKSGGRS
jgi:hypothetical protein